MVPFHITRPSFDHEISGVGFPSAWQISEEFW